LQRGGVNFFVRDGRIKIEEWFDISAHNSAIEFVTIIAFGRSLAFPMALDARRH
jgi:hypothetical protein